MPPLCPRCSATMVLKVAYRGTPKERLFWGCSNFPFCRGGRDYIESDSNQSSVEETGIIRTNEFIDTTIPVAFEAEPFSGFESMDSYETIAVDSSVLGDIRNERIDSSVVQDVAKFRIDYTESKGGLSGSHRQISALVLRLLCRGSITTNSRSIESAISDMFPGTVDYTEKAFYDSRFITKIEPLYPYDSPREKLFAETVLKDVIGNHWPHFTQSQLFIQTIGRPGRGDSNFAGQRTDFLISTAYKDIIVELDGDEHISHSEKDAQRDAFLRKNGYKVYRFNNEDLDNNPKHIAEVLSGEFKRSDKYISPSLEIKRIVASKIIHQLQIAVVSGLIRGTLKSDSCVSVFADINGFSSDIMARILDLAIDDLRKVFENYCRLYDEEAFFNISTSRSNSDTIICIGKSKTEAPSAILITDISTTRRIENNIPTYSDLIIASPSEEILLFFLDYIFHFSNFREGQQAAVERLISGLDSIVLLPTGSGKSLIYQLSAFLCPGKIIVVSPLVSLMNDQLVNLFYYGIDCAISISRDNTQATYELNNPGTALIYISPERLQIRGFRDSINSMQSSSLVFAVAVDEAHCVSEWGHDFRTAYLNIGRTSRTIFNRNGLTPTIIALTGTASTAVLKDVKRELEITGYDAIITPETFDRKELKFKVVRSSSERKKHELVELIGRAIPDHFGKNSSVFYRLKNDDTNCGIVFCPHVNGDYGVTKVMSYLNVTPAVSDIYSGSRPKNTYGDWEEKKKEVATKFKSNKVNTLVATKAFGMGIDKPNVRFTIHYGIPSSIESFYQEAGRAGRDGNESLCAVILSDDNAQLDDYILNPTTPLDEVQKLVDNQMLDQKDDVSRMMWFHVNSFKGIEFEVEQVNQLLEKLFYEDQLSHSTTIITCGSDKDTNSLGNVQKALQRLLVLGVVSDYTVDYSSGEIYVLPGSDDPEDIQYKYSVYVKGYNEGRISTELRKLARAGENPRKEYVLNAAEVLTEFVYDTIEKGRRRGLREMLNATTAALKSRTPDTTLRTRIVRYFESTYSEELTEIVESGSLGFDKIPGIIDGASVEIGGEVIGGIRSSNEAAGLRGGVSRFLESTPDHPGLLALRALAELYCKDYDIHAIKDDFEAACSFAVNRYSCNRQNLLELTTYFMRKVIERNPELFSALIDCTNSFIEKEELCEMLIDSSVLTEEQKYAPAIVFFSIKTKHAKGLIAKITEGK